MILVEARLRGLTLTPPYARRSDTCHGSMLGLLAQSVAKFQDIIWHYGAAQGTTPGDTKRAERSDF